MTIKRIKCTKHASLRFNQRVKPESTCRDIEQYVLGHPGFFAQQHEKEINLDGVVFVTAPVPGRPKQKTLITVFKNERLKPSEIKSTVS